MIYRCAILDDYQGVALSMADWASLEPAVTVQVFRDRIEGHDDLCRALGDFEILCLMRERTPLPSALIAALPNLRFVISTGGQNLSIDVAAANARGITVCGTAALPHPTVELTFALILEFARRAGRESEAMRAGKPWQDRVGLDLFGKTLGIVGLGRLGTSVAAIAKAFGMTVLAWSPNLTPERCAAAGVAFASKAELLRASDVVSLHIQLSPRTRNLIDAEDLAAMKPGAFLVNTSRGEIVGEAALLAALRERRIAGAAMDVFAREPLSVDHPFRRADNVLLTPHIGFVTEDNYRTYYGGVVEGIRAWLAGKPVRVAASRT